MTEPTTPDNAPESNPDCPAGEPSWFELACAAIGAWLGDALKATFEGPAYERAREIREAAIKELEASAFGVVVPKAMSDSLQDLLLKGHEDEEAARLWGCAVARAAVSAPDQLTVASYLVENLFVAFDTLVEALTELLQAGTADRLLDGFQIIVTSIRDHPDEGAYSRDKAHFRQIAREWKKVERVDALWIRDFDHIPWSHHGLYMIRALRPVDRRHYLAMLEETALPQAVGQELWTIDLRSDLTELLALLEAAPSVQADPEQPQWNGRMTAPILLSVAIELADKATGAPRSDDLTEEQEAVAKAQLSDVARTLLARPDGRFLALCWLAHLIGEDHRRDAGVQKRSVVRSAIDAVSEELVVNGASYADVYWAFPRLRASMPELKDLRERGVSQGKEHRGISATDAFLVAFLLETSENKLRNQSSGSALIEMYRTILLKRDPGLYTFNEGVFPNGRHFSPAILFCEHGDPAALWREIWLLLSEQRRRAQYRVSDHGSEDPSFFHLCVGIGLVDWLIVERPVDAGRVWNATFDAAFPTALTLGWVSAGRWRHAIAKLFARLPLISRTRDPSADAVSETADQLIRIGGDDELLAWCAAMSRLNGIDIGELARVCGGRGMDLGGRFQEFLEWETRSGNRRPASPVLAQIQEMLAEAGRQPRKSH